MSKQYDDYLKEHIQNVNAAFNYIRQHCPHTLPYTFMKCALSPFHDHDSSKFSEREYLAYDEHFYGGGDQKEESEAFKRAWLQHIHYNPHHWQHWVLIEDESGAQKLTPIMMPSLYVIEMVCDWWSFSWKAGNLYEIFDWYEKHKDKMILHENTREYVEEILDAIHKCLDASKEGNETDE